MEYMGRKSTAEIRTRFGLDDEVAEAGELYSTAGYPCAACGVEILSCDLCWECGKKNDPFPRDKYGNQDEKDLRSR